MDKRYTNKVAIEVKYCSVCGYLPTAAWIATEIWHTFGGYAPVTLTPVGQGRLEITANGDMLFDRKAEGRSYPEMKELKQLIADRLDEAVE
jgi:selenoprotein W-related protein